MVFLNFSNQMPNFILLLLKPVTVYVYHVLVHCEQEVLVILFLHKENLKGKRLLVVEGKNKADVKTVNPYLVKIFAFSFK